MKDKGKYWMVPADYYPPLDQGVVLVSKSPHKQATQKFLEFIRTKEASEVLEKYGFTLPQN